MKIRPKKIWELLKATGIKFGNDNPFAYSASIAYYTIFSLPAMVLIIIYVAGLLYEDATVKTEIINQVQQLTGKDTAAEVEKIMSKVAVEGTSIWARILGFATLLFSATTVVVSLQYSLNTIWRIKPKPQNGIWMFVKNRLLSLAMVASIGFVLLVSLVLDAIIRVMQRYIEQLFSDYTYILIFIINQVLSLAIIASVFAVIFKVLPDVKIKWRDVFAGAILTTLLFTLGKYLIGLYVSNSDMSSTYGTAGSLVILLAWVYYSVLIMLFGAEFTYVYALKRGRRIRPSEHAVAVKISEVEYDEVQRPDDLDVDEELREEEDRPNNADNADPKRK
jgi:membrane protein